MKRYTRENPPKTGDLVHASSPVLAHLRLPFDERRIFRIAESNGGDVYIDYPCNACGKTCGSWDGTYFIYRDPEPTEEMLPDSSVMDSMNYLKSRMK